MPRLVAMSWGAVLDRRPPLDGVTARDDENSWQLPKAVADTVLDIRAFDFGGQSRRAFAFASDGGWLVMDFDREAYVPLAAYLRSADAYSIETHETSRTMPGCLVD